MNAISVIKKKNKRYDMKVKMPVFKSSGNHRSKEYVLLHYLSPALPSAFKELERVYKHAIWRQLKGIDHYALGS